MTTLFYMINVLTALYLARYYSDKDKDKDKKEVD